MATFCPGVICTDTSAHPHGGEWPVTERDLLQCDRAGEAWGTGYVALRLFWGRLQHILQALNVAPQQLQLQRGGNQCCNRTENTARQGAQRQHRPDAETAMERLQSAKPQDK